MLIPLRATPAHARRRSLSCRRFGQQAGQGAGAKLLAGRGAWQRGAERPLRGSDAGAEGRASEAPPVSLVVCVCAWVCVPGCVCACLLACLPACLLACLLVCLLWVGVATTSFHPLEFRSPPPLSRRQNAQSDESCSERVSESGPVAAKQSAERPQRPQWAEWPLWADDGKWTDHGQRQERSIPAGGTEGGA